MSTLFIKTISFSRLRNAHHVGFHSKVNAELTKIGYDKLGIDEDIAATYNSAIQVEQDLVNRARGSEQTVKMKELDEQRDKLFRKLIYQIKAVIAGGPTSTITSDSIGALQTKIIGIYPISLADGGLQEETAKLSGLVKDLQVSFYEETEALGMGDLITELDTVNKAYEEAFMERIREKAAGANTLEVRGNTEDAYLKISFYLNSMANVVSTVQETKIKAKYAAEVVKDVNALISYYQAHYYSKASASELEVIEDTEGATDEVPEATTEEV